MALDDPNECSGDHTCSSTSKCLDVDQQMTQYSSDGTSVFLTEAYVQVIRFDGSGQLIEIHTDATCTDNNVAKAWIESVDSSGQPTHTHLREMTVIDQPFAAGARRKWNVAKLASPLDVHAGDRIGFGLDAPTDVACTATINREATYPGGGIFQSNNGNGWNALSGSMVFKTLVSR